MAEQSRRKFLQYGSVGALTVGAALTPGLMSGGAAAAAPVASGDGTPAHEGPVMAYVKDHKTGDIAVMAGDHEVVYRDRELAARLARIAHQAQTA